MNTQPQKNNSAQHRVSMTAREQMEIRGVVDVVSFDEQSIVLDTTCGNMSLDGEGLHVQVLNLEEGIVTVNGRIDSVEYFDVAGAQNEKRGLWGKLFR